MNELKANDKRLAQGIVIESSVDKGLGVVATLIIKTGTLYKGDFIIAGSAIGNVRLMLNDQLKNITCATLSQPVKITGLNKTPSAGDHFLVSNDKAQIKELARQTEIIKTNENYIQPAINPDPNIKTVLMILKTDVHGSLEAIKTMLQKINIENTSLHILRAGVGAITENDINLAKSAKAIIVGFNIKPIKPVRDIADQLQVKILFYNIIYKLYDDVAAMLLGQLDPQYEEKETGEAKILQI
jgi:translation initiation factor IF-2